ncbi:MAG: prepilin-type N-terminal cleavage/methylation domain-containing protein [candidate division NC10 bacterium]|jgi:prepilin-type N-terminal cleavage/methylation domain-containing protein
MRRARDHQGLTLIEVLIAAAILAVGLLALLSAFPIEPHGKTSLRI